MSQVQTSRTPRLSGRQVQVAGKLGIGEPEVAKTGFIAVFFLIVVLCGTLAILTLANRHWIATVYSQVQ